MPLSLILSSCLPPHNLVTSILCLLDGISTLHIRPGQLTQILLMFKNGPHMSLPHCPASSSRPLTPLPAAYSRIDFDQTSPTPSPVCVLIGSLQASRIAAVLPLLPTLPASAICAMPVSTHVWTEFPAGVDGHAEDHGLHPEPS